MSKSLTTTKTEKKLPPIHPGRILFADMRDEEISINGLAQAIRVPAIRPALAKIGLGSLNYQILRRTWATEFDSEGNSPHTRAALAGHSVDVSENIYRQTKPEDLRRAVDDWSKGLQ